MPIDAGVGVGVTEGLTDILGVLLGVRDVDGVFEVLGVGEKDTVLPRTHIELYLGT